MDKMNGKFFKYTLILLSVAILFIIVGGISVARVKEYEQPEVEPTMEVTVQEYEDLQTINETISAEKQQIVDILHEELADEEKIDKIETVLFGEPQKNEENIENEEINLGE